MKKEKWIIYIMAGLIGIGVIALILILLFGSKMSNNIQNTNKETTAGTSNQVENFNTKILAVVKEIDSESGYINFYDIKNNEEIRLTFNGGTEILDKYGLSMAISQLSIGEIVEANFIDEKKKLVIMKISKEAWEYKKINELNLNKTDKTMKILGEIYKYTENLFITSNNKSIGLLQLNNKDELTVKGYEKEVYSIIVDKGHGYIRLTNYDDFIGGSIEIGNSIILPVTKDMLIAVTEGNYKVIIDNEGLTGIKNVNVLRDQEMSLDFAEFKKEVKKVGGIDFLINPFGAILEIDGEEVDYEEMILLEYGNHKVKVSLSGYVTFEQELKIDSPYLAFTVQLKDLSTTNTTSATQSTTQVTTPINQLTTANTTTEDGANYEEVQTEQISEGITDLNHKIIVQKPENVDVYFDGVKQGTSPVEFTKKTGNHVITISASGYITKSYSVTIKDDNENITYSFPSLVKE